MHTIVPPNTDSFKQLELYTTMNKVEWKSGKYAATWNELFANGIPKEYSLWIKANWNYLKFLYLKTLLNPELEGIYCMVTFEQYCKEAYAVFKHNLLVEKFENIGSEISDLVGG